MLYGEREIQDTVIAIAEKQQPEVSVSLDQLKAIQYDNLQSFRRYTKVYYDRVSKRKNTIMHSPHYSPQSPYDEWYIHISQRGKTRINPYRNIDELYRPVILSDWMPYITTAFLQDESTKFLEYMRLIQSIKGNPFVEPVFYGANNPNERFKWVDFNTGIEHAPVKSGFPPLFMYPHTYTDDKKLNLAITLERFQEIMIYEALEKSFTIMDIARTNDADKLEWAYKKVLNRTPYIKSQIGESSIVKFYKDGKYFKSISVSLHPEMQAWFKKAADDAIALIRPNRMKLAERAIEVRALETKGVTAPFIGPQELDPLPHTTSLFKPVNVSMNIPETRSAPKTQSIYTPPQPVMPTKSYTSTMENMPSQFEVIQPTKPKTGGVSEQKQNIILPIAGVTAAALGIYAATR